jgi:hypothetical protein
MRNQKLARAIKRARARGFERGWYVAYFDADQSLHVMQSPQDVNPAGLLHDMVTVLAGPMKLLEATAEKRRLVSEEAERQRSSVPVT